jgi:hypothetical protein
MAAQFAIAAVALWRCARIARLQDEPLNFGEVDLIWFFSPRPSGDALTVPSHRKPSAHEFFHGVTVSPG